MTHLLPLVAQATQPVVTADPLAGLSSLILAVASLLTALASIVGTAVGIALHFSGKGSVKAVAAQAQALADRASKTSDWLRSHDEQLTGLARDIGQAVTVAKGQAEATVPAASTPAGIVGGNVAPTFHPSKL